MFERLSYAVRRKAYAVSFSKVFVFSSTFHYEPIQTSSVCRASKVAKALKLRRLPGARTFKRTSSLFEICVELVQLIVLIQPCNFSQEGLKGNPELHAEMASFALLQVQMCVQKMSRFPCARWLSRGL